MEVENNIDKYINEKWENINQGNKTVANNKRVKVQKHYKIDNMMRNAKLQ